MNDREETGTYGEIVNGTVSSRAPRIKLNPVRYLFRDLTILMVFKFFLFFATAGGLVFALWSKVIGSILLAIALLIAVSIRRYLKLRKIEFQNAVLCPGMVIGQNPPTVLILSDLRCGGAKEPIWAVKWEDCRSLKPHSSELGTRIPCVTAFQGSGVGGSWDTMVSSPLSSGTGDKAKLGEALTRLDDETEWQILTDAIRNKRFPEIGKIVRL